MTSDWVLIDLEVKEPDTCKSRETWTFHSDKKSMETKTSGKNTNISIIQHFG